MKSIAKVILVSGFLIASQAVQANGTFPADAMEGQSDLPVQSTYADRHANDPVKNTGPAARADMDWGSQVPVQGTYVERHKNDPVKSTGSVFPAADRD